VNWSSKLESREFLGLVVVEPVGMPESSFPSRDMFVCFCWWPFSSVAEGSTSPTDTHAGTVATGCCPCSRRGEKGSGSQFVE
jgi:hypothetical protein